MGDRRLHIRLRPAAETQVRKGHPWVFAESIREQNRAGRSGELAIVFDRKDSFLAAGLYDAASPIRVRILHSGKSVQINEGWLRQNLLASIERRASLFDPSTTGYRLVHGENDRWPGLVLDRYANTLVLKLYTAAWLPWLGIVQALILEQFPASTLVLRLSRNIAADAAGHLDGQVLAGNVGDGVVRFIESGIAFEAEVLRGQKTGFFLDQRENRRRVEQLAQGAEVLNAFSFSGGFSLYAARGGARTVTDLDISEHALASSRRNFAINDHPLIKAARHQTVQADVFRWLGSQPPQRFDLVILDPPSLARRETERSRAIRAYEALNASGVRLLRPGGVLMAASCSAHVSSAEFFSSVLKAASDSGRRFQELERATHPPDHPAIFREAHYLKAIYLRFA